MAEFIEIPHLVAGLRGATAGKRLQQERERKEEDVACAWDETANMAKIVVFAFKFYEDFFVTVYVFYGFEI